MEYSVIALIVVIFLTNPVHAVETNDSAVGAKSVCSEKSVTDASGKPTIMRTCSITCSGSGLTESTECKDNESCDCECSSSGYPGCSCHPTGLTPTGKDHSSSSSSNNSETPKFDLSNRKIEYSALSETSSACGGSANNPCACSERFICDGNGKCGCQRDQLCADTNCGNNDAISSDRKPRSLGRTKGGDIPIPPLMEGDPSRPAKDDGKRTVLPVLDGRVQLLEAVRTCERDLTSNSMITVVTMGRMDLSNSDSIFTHRYTASISDPIHKAWLASVPNQDCQHLLQQANTKPTPPISSSTSHTLTRNSSNSEPNQPPSHSCIVEERLINTLRVDGAVEKTIYPLKNACSVCALVRWDFFQDGETMYPLGGNSTIVRPNSTQNVIIYPTKYLASKDFKVTGVDVCP